MPLKAKVNISDKGAKANATIVKKILIISYFFPPSNFAGSYRIASWAKYLHKFGYYPVIITRKWNENQTETTDEPEDNSFSHEKFETHEVYRLPYHLNLRDRLHHRYGDSKFRLFRKFLTFCELILQHYSNSVIPYSNLYDFAKDLIRKENDYSCLLVSGRPFQLFKFGNMLHRETSIKWIADYRDEWNTHQWVLDESLFKRAIRNIESASEKNWLKTATLFTTCSDAWVRSIGTYIGREGRTVLNGYDDSLFKMQVDKAGSTKFTVLHNGTLYSSQPIEVFLNGYKKFIDTNKDPQIQLLFPGIEGTKEQGARVNRIMQGYEKYFKTTPRIPKQELMKMMAASDLFLMIGTEGAKGHHSSKIFEYLACRKPIVLCPNDRDVMEEVILDTKAGIILQTESEVYDFLNKSYQDFLAKKPIAYSPDWDKINFYSRENQAQALAKVIDEVISM